MSITLNSYPVPNLKVVGRIVDNEAVLVLPEQGQVKVLNEVGARVWKLTDGSVTAREIAGKISAEYQVEKITAEEDVVDFIELMVKHKVIKLSDSPILIETAKS